MPFNQAQANFKETSVTLCDFIFSPNSC